MKPRQEHERCQNCPAWDNSNRDDDEGFCRGDLPDWDEDGEGTWPRTSSFEWCIPGIKLMREED